MVIDFRTLRCVCVMDKINDLSGSVIEITLARLYLPTNRVSTGASLSTKFILY